MPDTIYMLARSLRAGMSLEQAIELIGRQGMKPLANEFQRAHAQIELGLTVPAALQLSADRLGLLDFSSFVSLVTLHHNTGGNLAVLLDRLAANIRDHNQFRNHFLAATALGRTTAIFLAGAAPALLLAYAIFQPDFAMAFFQSTGGWITLGVILTLEIIGGLWLFQLLRYDA
jgi:tight adherence protein B